MHASCKKSGTATHRAKQTILCYIFLSNGLIGKIVGFPAFDGLPESACKQNDGKDTNDQANGIGFLIGSRLKTEHNGVIARWNSHTSQGIVYTCNRHFLAIYKCFPAVRVVDLAEYYKLVGRCIELVRDNVIVIFYQFDRCC